MPGTTQEPFALVADIGGTSARLALACGGKLLAKSVRVYRRADFPDPVEAIRQFVEDSGRPLSGSTACIAIATPVDRQSIASHPGRPIRFTNSPWSVVPTELQNAFELDRLIIINDFEAQAYALPHLSEQQVTAIGTVAGYGHGTHAQNRWPLLVAGPGTGFGASLWLPRAGRAICTEGGQIGFAPTDDVELALLGKLIDRFGHVPVERLLSGDGLVVLHETLHDGETLDAADITAAAIAGSSKRCEATLQGFFDILGTTVGDLALATGARGGVYLAGGILPRVSRMLLASRFRERFIDKGNFRAYLDAVPTWLVNAPHVGLMGAAAAAELI